MKNLKKELGFYGVFSIATGTMISSGIFILPGLAFAKTGPAVFVSYFFSGILAILGVMSIAELSSAMPKAGGDYFYVTRSLGPLTGTIGGIISWIGLSLKTAFALIGISEILFILFNINVVATSLILCAFFGAINIVGVKDSAFFEMVVVTLLLVLSAFYIILGFENIDVMRFNNFSTGGMNSMLKTSGFVFVAYGGLLKVSSIAEEVKNPKKTLPLGLFTSLFITMILYSFMVFIAVGTLHPEKLSGSLTPIADSAKTFAGSPGFFFMTLAALLAFVSTGNAGIMAASRYPLALSRDKLLPEFLSRIPAKPRTPVVSILATCLIIFLALLLKLENLVKVASTSIILTYILIQISVIVLRESRIENYKPSFKAPFYPWLQICCIILFILLIIDMGITTILLSLIFVFAALILFLLYGRRKNKNEYALLHLIERITNKKIVTDHLELELKKIISDRDEIVFDRFDKLIDSALIFDVCEKIEIEDFFKMISEGMSQKLNIPKEKILQSFLARENLASTAITPLIAIPHIVVDGEKIFEIVVARCSKGLKFSEENPSVKAVFIVFGSMDERNFHLQTLSAIAQIVLNPGFEKKWSLCKNEQALKDLIHLSERKRFHGQ
ncbi:amino acid permease [candidate division WOR-3 bacterium]|nr:amino acid permease [candidate division WOR-3 bacterium]